MAAMASKYFVSSFVEEPFKIAHDIRRVPSYLVDKGDATYNISVSMKAAAEPRSDDDAGGTDIEELAIGWPDLVEFYFSAPRDPVAGLFSAPSGLSPPQLPSVKTPVDLGGCSFISEASPDAAAEFLAAVLLRREIKVILAVSFYWRYPYKSSGWWRKVVE
ncbi:hypothetical protein EDB19DRAFT_1912206 [Suillus lakei]|nr:hypothetical protein EDB19DRAFT_1912206 [Suillus lakei]